MLKVLLVDDEAMARVGLRSTFDWEGNGFCFIGEASNGKKAMEWIENEEVDILITDIAMPVMDGLELTRLARQRCPWIKVLLLSCHNDFEYVREGIRLGASDYLLKPTLEPEELKQILDKIKEEVYKERNQQHLLNRLKEQEETDRRMKLEKMLVKLLAREEAPDQALPLPWLNDRYRAVVCLLDHASRIRAEVWGAYIEIVIEEAQEWFYKTMKSGIAFRGGSDHLILLTPTRCETKASIVEQLQPLRAMMHDNGYSFTFGISSVFTGVEQLHLAYREAMTAAQLRFFDGTGGIYITASIPEKTTHADNEHKWADIKNRLKELIVRDDRKGAGEYLEHLFTRWEKGRKTPDEVMREAKELVSLFHACKHFYDGAVEQMEAVGQMETVGEMRDLLRSIFAGLWRQPRLEEQDEENKLHQRIVQQAVDYMNRHVTGTFSLQDVADYVGVSKNYFSEMFKRVTGQNFIDYSIQLRINRAKELLRTTTWKVYEVAEMSGFNDVKHFSKVFKKIVKVSPAEFREKGAKYPS